MKLGEYRSPRSLDEAVSYLKDPGSLPYGGGSDLIVKAHRHPDWYRESVYVDLGQVKEAGGIRLLESPGQPQVQDDRTKQSGLESPGRRVMQERALWIGASETITHIIESPLVMRHVPLLKEAASHLGSLQIRNRATIGGNVANGCPASDLIPALAVLGAQVVVISPYSQSQGRAFQAGETVNLPHCRSVPIRNLYRPAAACRKHEDMQPSGCFYRDPLRQRTVLGDGEWILGLGIPVPASSSFFSCRKLSADRNTALGILNLAMLGEEAGEGKTEVTWCFGGILPFPGVVRAKFDPGMDDPLSFAKAQAEILDQHEKENCPDTWTYKRRAAAGLICEGLMDLVRQRETGQTAESGPDSAG